jgi:hypothetical protein
MYALDNKKPTQQRLTLNDVVTFLPIVLEEPHEVDLRNATSNR